MFQENGISQVWPVAKIVESNPSHLWHGLVLFVPTISRGERIPHSLREQTLLSCRKRLCQLCGGTTEWFGKGWWLSENEEFIHEDVTIVVSMFTSDWRRISSQIFELCKWLKETLRQDEVMFSVDSRLYRV